MANQKHLDILKQGVEMWNAWRKEHPEIQPNLSGADFSKCDLSGAYFFGADLSFTVLSGAYLQNTDLNAVDLFQVNLFRANLSDAKVYQANLKEGNLKEANLSRAFLRKADLSNANLSGASLSNANLSRVNLNAANLSGVDLSDANLSGVDLTGVDLSDAEMGETIFGAVDLSMAKGLETVKHWRPSIIDIDTVYRSHANIPEVFLRGAGVPDSFIIYAHSLVGKPIDYYACFISYSNKDYDFAKRLHADLQDNGVRCWFAPEDLKIGDHYHQRIDESIRLYDKLILILSEHAVQSAWVEREVVAASEKEDREQQPVLFPIRLDNSVMGTTKAWAADVRRRWHIGDFTQWKHHNTYQQSFERLLRDLKVGEKP